jgi:hypothetical protein
LRVKLKTVSGLSIGLDLRLGGFLGGLREEIVYNGIHL